jgi:hypothetical protein
VNFIGLTQVCSWSYENSVKQFVDEKIKAGYLDKDHVRTTSIGSSGSDKEGSSQGYGTPNLSEDDRNSMIIDAIRTLLSAEKV